MFAPLQIARSVAWRLAFAVRETGQAIERIGCNLQGIHSHEEALCRHATLLPVQYDAPKVAEKSFIAPSGLMVGNVKLGMSSSLWYNAIVRGEFQPVTIGKNTNVQDGAYIGASSEFSPPAVIGDNVTIGHGAVIKGATIGNNVMVGINAVVSEGCQVQDMSIIAAGAYVEEDCVVPSGEVWAGNPAKKLRDLKPAERDYLRNHPARYAELAQDHVDVMKVVEKKMQEYSL